MKIAILLMCFALSACGGGGDSQSSSQPTQTTQQPIDEQNKKDEAERDATTIIIKERVGIKTEQQHSAYADDERQLRFSLARSGQSGGSTDYDQHATLMIAHSSALFESARKDIITAATTYKTRSYDIKWVLNGVSSDEKSFYLYPCGIASNSMLSTCLSTNDRIESGIDLSYRNTVSDLKIRGIITD